MSYFTSDKHVFHCFTPLHCLISIAICKSLELNPLDVEFIIQNRKIKNERSYFVTMSIMNNHGAIVYLDDDLWSRFLFLAKATVVQRLRGSRINFYSPNLKTRDGVILYRCLKPHSLFSYDDGVGYLYKEGYFYTDHKKTVSRLIYRCIGRCGYKSLLDNARVHFSIFRCCDHPLNKKLKIVPLLDKEVFSILSGYHKELSSSVNDSKLDFFLGSPLSEANLIGFDTEIAYLTGYFNASKKVFTYLPHPAESKEKLSLIDNLMNVSVIFDAPFTSELILAAWLSRINTVNGFPSSVHLILRSFFRGEVTILCPPWDIGNVDYSVFQAMQITIDKFSLKF